MRRSRLERVIDVLRSTENEPILKTHFLSKANINQMELNNLLPSLIKTGLIRIIEGSKTKYRTTRKGQDIIRNFDFLLTDLEPILAR